MNKEARVSMPRYLSEEKDGYESLAVSDSDTLLGAESSPIKTRIRHVQSNLVCFVLGVVLSGLFSTVGYALLVNHNTSNGSAASSSMWSPINKDMDINYSQIRYDGRFKEESIYRQEAGPEVDAAWEALGVDLWPIQLPEDEAEKAGLTHSHVRINKKYGGGYPVNMEGLHHLHCLNLLRQTTYFNYGYYSKLGKGAFVNRGNVLKLHVSHCYDTLRQQLMCQTDTGVLGRVWYNESNPTPFIDFNTQHKCKNFDSILQWARDNQMPYDPERTPEDFLAPPAEGDIILSAIP